MPAACLLAVLTLRPLAAQQLPVLVPSAVPAWHGRAPALPDSVRPDRQTYWMVGAIIGTALMGSLGILFSGVGCYPGESCLDDAVIGFLIGASIGFPLGGIIGDALPRTTPDSVPVTQPPSVEERRNARRARQSPR
jgi:hypothetical protein